MNKNKIKKILLLSILIIVTSLIESNSFSFNINSIETNKTISLLNSKLSSSNELTSNYYYISNSNIYNVKENTSYSDFIANINEEEINVYDKDNNIVTSGIIKTGMKVSLDNSSFYNVIVKGDINGDGLIDIGDTVAMKLQIVELKNLSGAYLEATDTNLDGRYAKANDLGRIIDYQIGLLSKEDYYKIDPIQDNYAVTFTTNPEESVWTNESVTVNINARELDLAKERIQYSLDGINWEDGTSVIIDRNNTVVYGRITDGVNNIGQKSITIKNIDKINPTDTEPALNMTDNIISVIVKQTDARKWNRFK